MRNTIIMMLAVALASVPTFASAGNLEAGKAMYASRQYDAARAEFESILAQGKKQTEALYYLARICVDHGDLDRAGDYAERLVEIDAVNPDYQFVLARVYGERARTSGFFLSKKKWAGRWKDLLEKAYVTSPDHFEICNMLASYLLNAPGIGGGDKSRGLAVAREAAKLGHERGLVLLAYAYRKNELYDDARKVLDSMLAEDPDNVAALGGLVYLYLQQEDITSAADVFSRLDGLDLRDEEALQTLTYYVSRQGSLEDEWAYNEELLAMNPLLSDMRFELAKEYQSAKRLDDAVRHYEALIAMTPDHHRADKAKKRLRKIRKKSRR